MLPDVSRVNTAYGPYSRPVSSASRPVSVPSTAGGRTGCRRAQVWDDNGPPCAAAVDRAVGRPGRPGRCTITVSRSGSGGHTGQAAGRPVPSARGGRYGRTIHRVRRGRRLVPAVSRPSGDLPRRCGVGRLVSGGLVPGGGVRGLGPAGLIRPRVLGGDSDGPSGPYSAPCRFDGRPVACTGRSGHSRGSHPCARERVSQGAGALDSPAVAAPTGDAHCGRTPCKPVIRIRSLLLRDFFAGAAARAVPAVWTDDWVGLAGCAWRTPAGTMMVAATTLLVRYRFTVTTPDPESTRTGIPLEHTPWSRNSKRSVGFTAFTGRVAPSGACGPHDQRNDRAAGPGSAAGPGLLTSTGSESTVTWFGAFSHERRSGTRITRHGVRRGRRTT